MYEWQAIIKSNGRPQCVRRGVRGNPAALTDVQSGPNATNSLSLFPSLSARSVSRISLSALFLSLSLSVFVRFYLLLIAVIIIIIIIIGIQYSLFLDLRKYYLISVDLIDRVDQNY